MKKLLALARELAKQFNQDVLIVWNSQDEDFRVILRKNFKSNIHEPINLVTPDGYSWCGPIQKEV